MITLLTLALMTMSALTADPEARHDVMWVSLDERMFEHLRLEEGPAGFVADGVVIRLGEGSSHRIRYRIEGDAAWRIRRVALSRWEGPPTVVLVSDGEGSWTDGVGEALPSLEGCRDVDVQASPFTNTLAIRRLALEVGQAAEICVAFITIPGLEVRALHQRYTRLPPGPAVGTYRYESLESDFRAELPVDAYGLLLEYPGYFRRAGAR